MHFRRHGDTEIPYDVPSRDKNDEAVATTRVTCTSCSQAVVRSRAAVAESYGDYVGTVVAGQVGNDRGNADLLNRHLVIAQLCCHKSSEVARSLEQTSADESMRICTAQRVAVT